MSAQVSSAGSLAEAAGAGDGDALLTCRRYVDGGISGAGGNDQPQVRQAPDDLAGKGGSLAHEYDYVVHGQRLHQGPWLGDVVGEDVDVCASLYS